MQAKQQESETIIGKTTRLEGTIVQKGLVRIDGDFQGTIQSDGAVVISTSSHCRARITARSAIIAGILKGDIFVSEHLTILQGAKVIGNIFTPILETDGEIIIHGDITITCNPDTALKEMQQFIDRHPSKMYFSNSLPQYSGL